MRIRQLDLIRYGKFTDRVIDFGPSEAGKPDLHLVYGPNEAGKSTLFSAWLDLLYGINLKSAYNFLHDYKTMRIAATLESGPVSRRYTRIKKPAASLLDEKDQTVDERILAAEFGGLDRDAYRTMFSLDETSLEHGGEAILASKGDLGQLLFSASAGLSDLTFKLDRIRDETEEFHKPRAHKTRLADLKRRLDELKAERDAIDLAAGDHARLVSERDKAKAAFEQANSNRADLRLRLDRALRLLAALPQHARLKACRLELEGMERLPMPPAGWEADIPALRRREVELATALERLNRDLALLETAIASSPPEDPILAKRAFLDELEKLSGRALSELDDLPKRVAEREEAARAVRDILRRLDRVDEPNPARLVLPARIEGMLKGLMAAHSGLLERHNAALRECRRAEDALAESRDKLARDAGGAGADRRQLDRLADILASLRAVDHASRIERARQAAEAAHAQLKARLPRLAPWFGQPDELVALVAPPRAVIGSLKTRLDEALAARDRQNAELERLSVEVAGLEAEHAAIARQPGIITDTDIDAARQARETAWKQHRQRLDGESADTFRQALEADDRIGERRLTQVAETTRLHGMTQTMARLAAQKARLEQVCAEASDRAQVARQQFADLVVGTASALSPDMEPSAFEAWCIALEAAQEAAAALHGAERDRRAATEAAETARRKLADAMADIGAQSEGDDLERMTLAAQRFIDSEARRDALLVTVQTREAELKRRQIEADEAGKALDEWAVAWQAACTDNWLGEMESVPGVAEMHEILDALQALQNALSRRDSLDDRIRKMERDISDFDDAVSRLARELGQGAADTPHLLYRHLVERLRKAREEESRLANVRSQWEKLAAERATLEDEAAKLQARIGLMTSHFSVASLDAVEEKFAAIRKRHNIESQIETLARDIGESVGVADACEFDIVLDGIERPALEREIEELRPQSEILDTDANRLYADFSAAQKRLSELGSDDTAARLAEARRTVLLEIEEGARHYLELRLGAIATDQALRLYRDRHRSSMLRRASEAFSQLSRGSYLGLTTQRDGNQETLIALGADGSSKQAGDMSKGTQFQLYLALRVAGYQEYAATRPPVPFIADDIMESFDEFRAAEALTQLAAMAKSGQVIYLTHHQHICEIAQTVCPTVTVHNL